MILVDFLVGRHKLAPSQGVDAASNSGFKVLGSLGPGECACWQVIK
jgi:hypothetical protein